MTEHELDDVRTLFQSADLDHVPATRDLIGPAVAWGGGRRRRDRWLAAGVAGAAAVVAVGGAVALRPASAASQAEPAASGSQTPAPATGLVLRELDALRPYIPAGYQLTCQSPQNDFCAVYVLTSPTGGTSTVQWSIGPVAAPSDKPSPYTRMPLMEGLFVHKATAKNPLTGGTKSYPEGTVTITSVDMESHIVVGAQSAKNLGDPTQLDYNQTSYGLVQAGAKTSYGMSQSELVKELPWKNGKADPAHDHAFWGYNPAGPVLSPEQFAKMAAQPGFQKALKQVIDWDYQVMDANQKKAQAQHAESKH